MCILLNSLILEYKLNNVISTIDEQMVAIIRLGLSKYYADRPVFMIVVQALSK